MQAVGESTHGFVFASSCESPRTEKCAACEVTIATECCLGFCRWFGKDFVKRAKSRISVASSFSVLSARNAPMGASFASVM